MDTNLIARSGFAIDGVTDTSPCFVIGYRPPPSTYNARLDRNTGPVFLARWFGQELPKGYRSIGVITAGGDVQLAAQPPEWQSSTAVMLAIEVFGRGPDDLDAQGTLTSLFQEGAGVLHAALADGALAGMPPYRAVLLIQRNLDELADDVLLEALRQLSPTVRAALVSSGGGQSRVSALLRTIV